MDERTKSAGTNVSTKEDVGIKLVRVCAKAKHETTRSTHMRNVDLRGSEEERKKNETRGLARDPT